jgi:glycosyltransferase involved in cell wall biosynthesis
VFTVHGWAFTDGINWINSTLYKVLEKTLAILATKIIVVSYYDKGMALKNGVANEEKIEVVHNGIEVSSHKNNALAFKDVVDIVMIARFDLQKDHETLIRACVGINRIKVHFLGDGPNLEKMIKLADELAIRDKFKFYGYSNKVEEVLQRADVFVLISNWEGFPISTLEAINQNLPVIISDVGGAREAIIEGETGYSIKRKDITDLNAKLVKLIDNASLRRSMGDAGKKMLAREFSSEVMYKNTLNVFQKAIKKK